MAEVVEIDINAKDNTSRAANSARANFQILGREISGIGSSMTNIFTRPIMDLERFVMKNKEVQEAIKPINEAFSKAGDKLATSFVPIIERLTPALLSFADSLSKIIDWFSKLPPGVQDSILGFVGLLAALGPVLTTVGSLITTVGSLGTTWTTISGILAPIASGVLPAIGGALAAISAPVWLLIGAIVLLGATIAIFGKQAWQTVTDIGKIFQALWTLIQIKIDQIKQAFLNVDWGGIGRNIITGVINGIRSISVFGAISNAVNILRRASGGFASGLTLVGERGPELVNLPHGSYVNSNSASQRMAKGGGDFIYAPMFSMGNRSEVENTIAPMVKNIMRGR
jgi:hypothetical protein